MAQANVWRIRTLGSLPLKVAILCLMPIPCASRIVLPLDPGVQRACAKSFVLTANSVLQVLFVHHSSHLHQQLPISQKISRCHQPPEHSNTNRDRRNSTLECAFGEWKTVRYEGGGLCHPAQATVSQ